MTAQIALLADGRLHLQHGPIDLLCRAWGEAGDVTAAYARAAEAFQPVLATLCQELPLLRRVAAEPPHGPVARAMHHACLPFAAEDVTCMAAVAGAVADHVLAAMVEGGGLSRAFVNNGGDIAFHAAPGTELRCGLVSDLEAPALDGLFRLRGTGGIASSGRACKGRGGKSFSLGIADSVTVLARTAAAADAAATVIGNAVDLPGHCAILRRPADSIEPDSDLGARLVTWDVGALSALEVATALHLGQCRAEALREQGLIDGAVLMLRGQMARSVPARTLQEAA